MKILIRLKYDGSAYSGYQFQNDRPTVQKELTEAAAAVFGHRCDVTGCSRTDAGVHALCFCATVTDHGGYSLTTAIPTDKIPRAMNMHLPEDISVFEASEMADDFHPRYGVIEKTYKYLILNSGERDPFLNGRAFHFHGVLNEVDIRRMDEAAAHLIGKRDFSSFMASGSKIKDPVRTIKNARVSSENDGRLIVFTVSADGFLYNMVRIMSGTLLEVGKGKLSPEDMEIVILSRDRTQAGATLPPYGLYLTDVKY